MSELLNILIASVLNKQLKQYNDIESKAKILLVEFIDDLNNLIKLWQGKFISPDLINLSFDKNSIFDTISKSDFNEFITISLDWLIIDLDRGYEKHIKQILTDSIWSYSNLLLQNINELGLKLKQFKTRDILPAATVPQTEPAVKLNDENSLETENLDASKPEPEKPLSEDVEMELETESKIIEPKDESENVSQDAELAQELVASDNVATPVKPEEIEPSAQNLSETEVNEAEIEEELENIRDAEEIETIVREEQEPDREEIVKAENEVLEAKNEKHVEIENENQENATNEEENDEEKDSETDSQMETANESNGERNEKPEESESDQEDDTKDTTNDKSLKRKASTSSSLQQKRFQHIAVNLINSIQAHRYSSPFLQQVSKRDAPDYYDVIHEPRDLKNILKSVKLKHNPQPYVLLKELERDIVLMFANCVMYNKSDDDLVKLTISMKNDVNNIFKMFEEAELEIK